MTWLLLIPAAGSGIDTGAAGELVLLILTGGGALAIYTLVKAFLAVRAGVETREGEAIGNLVQWRLDADARADAAAARADSCTVKLELEREWGRYWQLRAARAERALAAAGLELPALPVRPAVTNE